MSQLEKEFTDKISRLEEERDSAVMVESEFRNSLTNTQKTKDQLEKKCEQVPVRCHESQSALVLVRYYQIWIDKKIFNQS